MKHIPNPASLGEHCIHDASDPDRILITQKGKQIYRSCFALVGYDVDQIVSFSEFEKADKAARRDYFAVYFSDMLGYYEGNSPSESIQQLASTIVRHVQGDENAFDDYKENKERRAQKARLRSIP